jgi:hypothetical protein
VGDRVLIQVVNGKEFSPVAYGHWCGSRTPEILAKLKARMIGRGGDVAYTFARLIQEMTDGEDGNVSFGVWNAPAVITAKDSHGDAGCVVIDVDRGFKVWCEGGYLIPTKDRTGCVVDDR